jgi:hypothetical protein
MKWLFQHTINIVRCSGVRMTNNCRFWIWWLGLFDVTNTITLGYNNSHIQPLLGTESFTVVCILHLWSSVILSYFGSSSDFRVLSYSVFTSVSDFSLLASGWVWVWVMLRPTVSWPVCLGIKHPPGAYDQIFITVGQLRVCWCGALSLKRGRVCLLYMLLVLASAVLLRSESLGTRDHISLFQIWDFPFCRLLLLAGSRWRYSTPPPHVSGFWLLNLPPFIPARRLG